MAQRAIKDVVLRILSGGGNNHVDSMISIGRRGSAPVAAKYGEQPMCFLTVAQSAQNME